MKTNGNSGVLKGEKQMKPKKEPHEKMTTKSNGLSSTQEVLYDEEFRKADNASKNQEKKENEKKNFL